MHVTERTHNEQQIEKDKNHKQMITNINTIKLHTTT